MPEDDENEDLGGAPSYSLPEDGHRIGGSLSSTVTCSDEDAETSVDKFLSACATGSLDTWINTCLKIPIGSVNAKGDNSALLSAGRGDGVDIMCWLRSLGESIRSNNGKGRTSSMLAARKGHYAMVMYVVARLSAVDIAAAKDCDGKRAVDLAAEVGNASNSRLPFRSRKETVRLEGKAPSIPIVSSSSSVNQDRAISSTERETDDVETGD